MLGQFGRFILNFAEKRIQMLDTLSKKKKEKKNKANNLRRFLLKNQ